jgi:HlyD family secretion protein
MKKYSKLIVAAIVALIFIGTFVFLYEKSQPKPVEYTEFTPKMADVLKTTVITGKIEPRNEVSVKPQISGIITEIACLLAGRRFRAGRRGNRQGKGDSGYGTAQFGSGSCAPCRD